jgi:hypothetical protein
MNTSRSLQASLSGHRHGSFIQSSVIQEAKCDIPVRDLIPQECGKLNSWEQINTSRELRVQKPSPHVNPTPARNYNTSACKHVLAWLNIRIQNNIFDRPWCFACDPLSKARDAVRDRFPTPDQSRD